MNSHHCRQNFPLVFEEAKAYFEKKGLHRVELVTGPTDGWRCRAKLAVRGTFENPLIGLYEPGTHNVIDMPNCSDHHPAINQAIERVRAHIKKMKIEPYNETTGRGVLRYIQLVVERKTGKIQLSFIINKSDELNPKLWNLDSDQENDNHELWHSIWLNFNTSRTNTILGSNWRLLKGAPLIWEEIAKAEVCFHPASFGQANLGLFEKALDAIASHVEPETALAEFYAGVGVIGLSLAAKCSWVRCCEVTTQAKECFELAKAKLPAEVAKRVCFYEGVAAKHLDLVEGADCVIVDPPRKGLDRAVLDLLKRDARLKRLIYLSCGWPSCQKDCEELLQSGWALRHVSIYLFFPGSEHIETLMVFDRI